ncbi:phosphotransferase family protein [Streptomyces sp. DEF147AK]|uniref:phosphotransferase family protein n=1 Tax=Streptomyces sp. DEF147AK TaxID=2759678 RepID=UPI001F2AB76B|nr:aminoglycoside phosphotransferase family protein [Streptomyces sp. DEF147AK]
MPHSAGDEDRDATGPWVRRWLSEGERVEEVVPLLGGWTSHMRRLDLRGPGGRRSLVLRSFVRPPRTGRPGLWQRAVDVIAGPPPPYRGCFLHRDFHPGNVLFTGTGAGLRVTGVVDWVETSWGPADLDVAHCSTALALLHGVPAGTRFADRYVAAGGTVDEDDAAHLHWRLLDARGHAPDAEKVAVPWRRLGRSDLTPEVLTRRLEEYLAALFDRYG